ncbi:MAG TPA: pyruvate kinase [Sphingobacteriaceae bacterium]|nr:pyruvate kinase [Sphingobacteriaceae bacterium]
MARTKIIATLGPATDNIDVLVAMIKAGMDVARVNLSHVTPESLTAYIEKVREAARLAQRPTLAVMLDTRGPEIRVGNLPYGGIKLTEGQLVHLVPGDGEFSPGEPWLAGGPGNPRVAVIPVTYGKLAEVVEPGQRILLDDGNFALDVEHVEAPRVVARVLVGGHLKARKRVTLPHQPGDLPVLTEADTEDLRLGLSLGADLVAASFIRDAADVLTVRRLIETMGSSAGVVAKVENRQAVEQLDEILSVADGIMVARGDLGVELTAEEVPVLQKEIIRRCNRAGKPVIIATQMLESMVSRPRPTRAEASDVANAIFDGADAVMLSAETSVGEYPVEAVEVMSRIATRAEEALDHESWLEAFGPLGPISVTDAISQASCTIAHKLGAVAIISATQSGHTARMVARYRPKQVLLAATPDDAVARRMSLVWGVEPLVITLQESAGAMRDEAIEQAIELGLIVPGDLVVFTAGVPIGVTGTTNLLQIHTVGEVAVRGTGVGQGSYSGPVRFIVNPDTDPPPEPGDVVVCTATTEDMTPLLEKAGALVAEAAGLSSHAAVLGLRLGVPTIVGAIGAMSALEPGEIVTVDAQRGLIYRGRATVK